MLKDDVQPYLPDLRLRLTTNRAVAKALGVTESYLARILRELGFKKIPSQSANERAAIAQRKILKSKRPTLATTLPVAEAAKQAGVSERTIYRERAKCKTTA